MSAKLHYHAGGIFSSHDGQNIFLSQRFEIKLVGSVIVGAYRLRIAINHYCLETVLLAREGRVHATIIKFYTLSNPVGAPAQNHYFFSVGGRRLVLPVITRVEIRSMGGEFGRTRIHCFVHRQNIPTLTFLSHLIFIYAQQVANIDIREPHFFRLT